MNVFTGIRTLFQAADALLRAVFGHAKTDGQPFATIARGLVDKTGKVVAVADPLDAAGNLVPQVATRMSASYTAGNVAVFDTDGNIVNSNTAAIATFGAGDHPNGNLCGFNSAGVIVDSGISEASVTAAVGNPEPFFATATLTSAAAATAVTVLADAAVPAWKKAYVQGFFVVNGATAWGTTTAVTIEDTAGVAIGSIAASALTAHAYVPQTAGAGVTLATAYLTGAGGTAAKGLKVVGDANGTGSDLTVVVWGVIK